MDNKVKIKILIIRVLKLRIMLIIVKDYLKRITKEKGFQYYLSH